MLCIERRYVFRLLPLLNEQATDSNGRQSDMKRPAGKKGRPEKPDALRSSHRHPRSEFAQFCSNPVEPVRAVGDVASKKSEETAH